MSEDQVKAESNDIVLDLRARNRSWSLLPPPAPRTTSNDVTTMLAHRSLHMDLVAASRLGRAARRAVGGPRSRAARVDLALVGPAVRLDDETDAAVGVSHRDRFTAVVCGELPSG